MNHQLKTKVIKIFKKLNDTVIQTKIDGQQTIYFEGLPSKIVPTKLNNRIIYLTKPQFLKVGRVVTKRNTPADPVYIIVPHRKELLINRLRELNNKEKYIFKLTKESRSGKFVLSEIFQGVETRT